MNEDVSLIIDQMEATLKLWEKWENLENDNSDSYLEFRKREVKLLLDYIKDLQKELENIKQNAN